MTNNYSNGIISKPNITNGNPYGVNRTFIARIGNNSSFGTVQIPMLNQQQGLEMIAPDNLFETTNAVNIGENEFYIDYASQIIYFNSKQIGQRIVFVAYDMGEDLILDHKICTLVDNNGNPIETLKDIIDSGFEAIDYLNDIGNAIDITNLLRAEIINGKNMSDDLQEKIICSSLALTELNKTINVAKEKDIELKETNNNATITNTNLKENIKKAEEVIVNANVAKDRLEPIVVRAETIKPHLDASATKGEEVALILDNAILNADITTMKDELSSSISYMPDFGLYGYWSGTNSDWTETWTLRVDDIKKSVDEAFYLGAKKMMVFIYTMKNTQGKYVIGTDIDRILEGVKYAKQKGIIVDMVKLYCKQFRIEFENADISRRNIMNNDWNEIIDQTTSKFGGFVDKICVANEPDNLIVGRTDFDNYVLGWINRGKINGMKSGIITISCVNHSRISESLLLASDYVSTNEYPDCGSKGIDSSVNEIRDSIYPVLYEWQLKMSNKYYNKESIISEIGCRDNDEGLIQPWIYSYNDNTTNDGIIQALMLRGILEATKNIPLSSVYWFYEIVNVARMKSVLKSYTGKVR